jgi:hypothetical protein
VEIRVTPLEFGKIIHDAHSDVNAYDVVRAIKYITIDTTNFDNHDFEYERKLVNNINLWLVREDFKLEGTKVIGVVDDYLVLDVHDEYGKQTDMFGEKSMLNLLKNAGLR